MSTIEEDLGEILRSLADGWKATDHAMRADGAIFSGIQIHGPDGTNFVWPLSVHIEVGGDLRDYAFTADGSSTP